MKTDFNKFSNIHSILVAALILLINLALHAVIIMLAWNYIVINIKELAFIAELTFIQAFLLRALIIFLFHPNLIMLDRD